MIDGQSSAQDTAQLARLLKEGRAAKGWTLREAAGKTGISNGYLSLIEQGDVKSPSPRYLMVLAERYELPFDRLMALAGHPSGSSPVLADASSQTNTGRAAGTAAERGSSAAPGAQRAPDWSASEEFVAGPVGGTTKGGVWASVEPVSGADNVDAGMGPLVHAGPARQADTARGHETPDATERRQLATLVLEDLRALSTADIAQVRAFIAGLRAGRRA